MTSSVMSGLLPDTNGVQFTARPALRTRDSARSTRRNSRASSIGGSVPESILGANSSLSSIEIEALLREKVRSKPDDILQAFQTYDVDQAYSVTKGEFRRVLENFCTPLTTDQFEAVIAKVDKNPNGTVKYKDFVNKFCYTPGAGPASPPGRRQPEKWTAGIPKFSGPPPTPKEINVDFIEKQLKDQMEVNLKSVVKALQLFDYNRDGRIQRHEMRRVIENYCFKLNDQQFDKLWQRYDFHHTGMVNYKDFLQRLGVNVTNRSKPAQIGAHGAMQWQQSAPAPHLRNHSHKQADEQMLQAMNFRQIEIEFRKRMRENYVNLKKAFMSFDTHLDGFTSVDDLHSILSQFTIPMSKQLFSQLMEKCDVNATGKIGWEDFLDKFQEPVTVGNGQTIPIKPAHKWFPVKEGLHTVEVDEIWKLLYKHVHSNYGSIKNAFLQFDINRNGRISRVELRNILEKFQIRLQDAQFKQLLEKIDPQHTNKISYQKFLAMFEERDTAEGHKWLNSCHRVNENCKPAIMAWETVEKILCEKITEYWKNVSSALLDYDYKENGKITPKNLKKVLDNYVLPVSEEHMQNMLSRCPDRTDTQVNYVQFLEMLKVDVKPSDLEGLSTQIFDGSNDRENQRQGDQIIRATRMIGTLEERQDFLSADEVIQRLKDRMAQHNTNFREAFIAYDRRGRGAVSKKDLKQMLVQQGFPMSDEQFNILVTKLNFDQKGQMRYTDFVASFSDPRHGGPGEDIQRSGNHRVNPIRGDQFGMTIQQVEEKLASKLRENFANLRGAFYKFDDNHNGSLKKSSFRRLLDSFMCFMSDEQFDEFCNKHGITKHSRISYPEFLERFEVRDTVEGHKWLNSCHKVHQTYPEPLLSAEDAFDIIRIKAHRRFKDLSHAFVKMGCKPNGNLRKKDLQQLLTTFTMPINDEQFSKLWQMFDKEKEGRVSFEAFLARIGASEFTPGDLLGHSSKIIEQSKITQNEHNQGLQEKHERITQVQANRTGFMTITEVEQRIKDKIRDNYDDFYQAFRKYDINKNGVLSINEIQKVLIDYNIFLDDDQFFALLDRCGLSTTKSCLNYDKFLEAFEEGRKSSYGPRKPDIKLEEQPTMSNPEAEHRLRELVAAQVEVLERAFCSFDKDNTSRILLRDFRRVLDLFCFKMTDGQWKSILSQLNVTADKVNYCMFLDAFTVSGQEESDRWLASLQKTIREEDEPNFMQSDEVSERLREGVQAHTSRLQQAFVEADYSNMGVVSKEDFKSIVNKTLLRLSDEQFEKLWPSVSVNEFGNVSYNEFIKSYSTLPNKNPHVVPPARTPAPLQRANTSLNARPESMALRRSVTRLDMQRNGMVSRSQSRMTTPMVNAESAEYVLKNTIYRNWKQIQMMCRAMDKDNSGTINVVDLKEILVKYGVDLSKEEFLNLMTKYDLRENGRFCYTDFLRHFIINLKTADQPKSLMQRRQIATPKLRSAGTTSVQFFNAMMRLRDSVATNWKEMRRQFRQIDTMATGLVDSIDFRFVLRQFSVNLDEDEFYHLLSYYDKNFDGKISYNEFIRAYLNYS